MKNIIKNKIIITSIILLLLGIITGVILLILSTPLDKLLIKEELYTFISNINNKITITSFLTSLKYNYIYIIIITICSILYLLSPIALFINYYKGIHIGFIISSIIYTYKLKGILYSIIILFPNTILLTILIILYSSYMFNISLKLIKATYNSESINLKIFIKKILTLLIITLIICIIISLLELYVNKYLINLIIN